MTKRTLWAILGLITFLPLMSTAEDSAQERIKSLKASEVRIATLQAQVVKAPDDRGIYRELIEAGLEQYELFYTRSRFQDDLRENILKLKFLLEDMYTIQKTISEMGRPAGSDGKELVHRLSSMKAPLAHRRSVPLVDPWGTPYRFFVYPQNGQYKIVSAGSDRKFETANLGFSAQELRQAPERRSADLGADIVFIDGRNFTNIFDYPKNAQAFLYTLCEPADEPQPERFRCW